MKKLKTSIIDTIMVMIIIILSVGCSRTPQNNNLIETTNNVTNTEEKIPTDEIGLVMDGIDVPEVVLEAAKSHVEQLYEVNRKDYPDYNYVNWRIENLTYSYTYDDLNGMQIVIFQLNYEFLSESPEIIAITGGMYITEGNWVMAGYPNSTYLIFQQDNDKLTFIQSIVENDCTHGTQLFTEDLLQILT